MEEIVQEIRKILKQFKEIWEEIYRKTMQEKKKPWQKKFKCNFFSTRVDTWMQEIDKI